jgi:general secretion pathway protein D
MPTLRSVPRFRRLLSQTLCVLMLTVMFAPAVYAGNGKKFFKAGEKFEIAKQWDKAAEQYAQALNEDPGNVEYQLRLQRALTNASILSVARGKQLEEQGDFEGAYHAYREGYSFDRTNEIALSKMKEMLKRQGIEANPRGEAVPFQRTAESKKPALPTSTGTRYNQDYTFYNQPLETIITNLCAKLRFNTIFERNTAQTIKSMNFTLNVKNISAAKALDLVLDANNLQFYKVDTRTFLIMTRNPSSPLAQKYDDSNVKTFYIRNAKLEEVKGVLNILGPGMAQQVQTIPQANMLVVRASAENLNIIERIVLMVDRPQAEVLMDVNIYEITQGDLLKVGNQFAVSSSTNPLGTDAFGGIGQTLRNGTPPSTIEKATSTVLPSLGGSLGGALNLGLALPSSTFSLLQTKNKAKLLAQTQVRAFEGNEASVNIGSSIPIQIGNSNPTQQPGTGTGQQPIFLGGGFNQVQYRDVGLNISIKPRITDDVVQMEMNIESSSLAATSASNQQNLTPPISQRKVKGVARVRDGETALTASVMSQNESNSVSGIPVLSFIPIIGRFFATPNQSKDATHIVITVTPHILRGGAITEEELKAQFGPLDTVIGPSGLQYGRFLSVDEIVAQADAAELREAATLMENPVSNGPKPKVDAPGMNVSPTSTPSTGTVPTIPASVPKSNNPIGDGIVRPDNGKSGGNDTAVDVSDGQSVSLLPTTGGGGVFNPGTAATTPATPTNPTTPANPNPRQNPVPALLSVTPTARPQVGQTITVAAIVSGYSSKISAASVFLHYNPAVLKVVGIRDGGLLSPGSFQSGDNGGQVFANVLLTNNPNGVPAAGQIAVFDFQVIGPGPADLRMDIIELRGTDNQFVAAVPNPAPLIVATAPQTAKREER